MSKSTTYKQDSKFWIALIDMMTSILIIFLLVTFVDTILNPKNIELAIIDKKRGEFVELLEKRFNDEIRDSTIRLKKEFDHLQITFSDKILFETGDYDLQIDGKKVLRKCAWVIKDYARTEKVSNIKTIQVEGHTDNIPLKGRYVYPFNNWELSTARAIAVIDFFGENQLSKALFSANGYEANRPVSTTNPDKNRRIELKIFFSADN